MKRRIFTLFLALVFVLSMVSTAEAAALKLGSKGSEVKRVQQRLIDLGYLKDKADGSFGPKTRDAVLSFQRANGLEVDGYVGPATMAKLFSSTVTKPSLPDRGSTPSTPQSQTPITRTLKLGSRGEDVKTLQRRLNELGFSVGSVDGSFGSKTKTAVMNFQRSRNLAVDGSVGPATRAKLFESTTPSTPSTPTTPPVQQPNPSTPQSQIPITRTLKFGSKGEDVKILQRRLNELGFSVGSVDGSFGNATKTAVMNFQRSRNLEVDGSVGPATRAKLFEDTTSNTPPTQSDENLTYHGQANALKGKIVFLDAGHGGPSSPGVSKNGVLEKVITLDITLRAKRMLEEAGAAVILTRSTDTTSSLYNRSSIVNSTLLSMIVEEKNGELLSLNSQRLEKETQLALKTSELDVLKARVGQATLEVSDKEDIITELAIEKDQTQGDLDKAKSGENQEQISYLEARLGEIDAEILKTQNDLEALNEEIDSLNDAISKIQGAIEELSPEIASINSEIAKVQVEIDEASNLKSKFNEFLKNPSYDQRTGIFALRKESNSGNIMNSELERVFDLENQYSDRVVFLSIHINSTAETETNASGINVYWRPSSTAYSQNRPYYDKYSDAKRKKLAESILKHTNLMSDFNKKQTTTRTEDFSVLRENNTVSNLIELGFMNNTKDRELLTKENTREKLAYGIHNGLVEYFK